MNIVKYDKTGKKMTSTVTVDELVFENKINKALLSQVVYVYLSNQRQSNAHTKTRSEVSGGGRKPWRQKGTGRARHGSTRSPIWAKGGVTFGPRNNKNYKKDLNKKMRLVAFRSAFSAVTKEGNLAVIEDFTPQKTKEIVAVLEKMNPAGKVTFLQAKENGLYKAAKNLLDVDVKSLADLSIYDVLNAGQLVVLENALPEISNKWGKAESKKTTVKSEALVKTKKVAKTETVEVKVKKIVKKTKQIKK
jgi:large subunit ribosomal protein L4